MVSGGGIYHDGTFCAMVVLDTRSLKADGRTVQDYEAKGRGRFKPFEGKPVAMHRYEVPLAVLEDLEGQAFRVRKGVAVARPDRRKGRCLKARVPAGRSAAPSATVHRGVWGFEEA